MHKTSLLQHNFLIVSSNNHPMGFEDALYMLEEGSNSFSPNAVVLINYSHKNFLLHNKTPDIHYYKIREKQKCTLNEILPDAVADAAPIKLRTCTTKEEYVKRVQKLKQHIQLGDIYEINFCVEFEAVNVELDPFVVFKKLNTLAEAPYAALAKLGNTFIISASPELFLQKQQSRLITKPIKGTAKRSINKMEDDNLKNQLHLSLKERTENVMIVDVARNDLSVIAKRATVTVPKLYAIETYKTVHQMVSTVQCELKEDVNFDSIIAATFPMPSMTGAPKIRAMELIDDTEQFKRKEYSGALGVIDQSGNFNLSVLIRTIIYDQQTKRLSFAVGSAITHMCDPEAEYEECLLKANALIKAINGIIE
jgi:para-aminobenzoate synthetase component 1